MTSTDRDQIEKLVEGELGWDELGNDVLPDPKDPQRFEVTREVLEDRVEWSEPILAPLNDHLYVVAGEDGRVVKSECGRVYCDADENWKTECRVRVRESEEEFLDLYPRYQTPHPDWSFQLREFICPECYKIVDADAVPAGYPVLQPFEPDVDTFFEEWLGEPVPEGPD